MRKLINEAPRIAEGKGMYTNAASNIFFDKDSGKTVKVRYSSMITFVKNHANGTVEFDWDGDAIIAKQCTLENMLRRGLIEKG